MEQDKTIYLAGGCFWGLEEYHQDYLKKNPGGYCHINVAWADRFNKNEKGS